MQYADGSRLRFAGIIGTWVVIAAIAIGAPAAPVAQDRAAHDYRDRHFDYFVAGDPTLPRARHTTFGLVLMGGGGSAALSFRTIADRAGHGHIVILRAVSDDSFDPEDGDYGKSFVNEWGPVLSAQTIVFHDRQASFDPRVIAALRNADGIFLAGGDQANYVRYWKGTPVQQLLNAHVAAKRPIGGSSAGLAILGHYSYTAFDGGSMESKVALSNPYDTGVTLETDLLHFQGLEHAITDSHFSARCRLGRLIVYVARLNAEQHDRIYGIGIDERTALVVDEDGQGRLLPGSAGSAWIVETSRPATMLAAGKPVTLSGVRVDRMDSAGTLDARTGKVARPAEQATLSISAGQGTGDGFALRVLARDAVPAGEN